MSDPSGLLGDVRKISLGENFSAASKIPFKSKEKSALRGTLIMRALFRSASKLYMPKVGGQLMMGVHAPTSPLLALQGGRFQPWMDKALRQAGITEINDLAQMADGRAFCIRSFVCTAIF